MTKQHFMFNGFKLNVEQTHDVAHQLFEILDEFNVQKNELFCGIRYRDHIIGKLKFFIDLYNDMSNIANINETVVIDNYYAMLAIIARNYSQEDLSDIMNDYEQFLLNKINEILDLIDSKNLSDIDDIISFISDYDYLNFQEQQFIVNCYYAKLDNK